MTKPHPKMIYVEWLDSCVTGGWRTDYAPVSTIRTVGWLVEEAEDHLKISAHFDNGEGTAPHCDVMTIPKRAILSHSEFEFVQAKGRR